MLSSMSLARRRLLSSLAKRHFSSSRPIYQTSTSPSSSPDSSIAPNSRILYTPTCPPSTCFCASAPSDLDIDRKSSLLNTVPKYATHVVICSEKDDWTSRIEDEATLEGDVVRGLKGLIGKGGKYFDPFNNVLLSLSSLPKHTNPKPNNPSLTSDQSTTILFFPTFQLLFPIPSTPTTLSALATAHLKPTTLSPYHDNLSPSARAELLRDESESVTSQLPAAQPISTPTILICGHGSRDSRCGILGPILVSEFKSQLARHGIQDARVGLISHIGGHKFAGNVIIYLPPPPGVKEEGNTNALSGCGIWYGRVGPEEVEVWLKRRWWGTGDWELVEGGVGRNGEDLGRVVEGQVGGEDREDRGEGRGVKT
ncbi:Sucrase/ferredoxin-like-domain-containing protein [Clohesyomyces aquaticus]|uniref:Altered inheritance of mitochondria protein 32 n=1 Tax=Clohesyomyces aquaticus TaxID=1231657 RepID=A0A1Y1Z3M3_9PLEO|nr:Sucrase/ferredoxin-like-domain-containing protein [Clohesyomyces aquaticus]